MGHVLAAWAFVLATHADASAVDFTVEAAGGRTVKLQAGAHPDPASLLAAEPRDGETRVASRLRRDAATWDCDVTLRVAPGCTGAMIAADPPGLPDGFLATLADHLAHASAWFARGASDPPPLSPRDRRAYEALNGTRAPAAPRRRIDEAVAQAARRHPGRVAVIDGDDQLTYRDLLDTAARIERLLLDKGCAGGDHVAVVMPRSFDAIGAYLAALCIGAVYVPLDPRTPQEQLRETLGRLARPFIVSGHASGVEVRAPRERRPRAAAPAAARRTAHDAACVMFTSGSTGAPKGVILPHLALTRLLENDRFRMFSADTVCLAASPVQWDCALFETWGTLIAGGTLILHQGPNPTPGSIRAAVRRGASMTWITASLLNVLIDEDVACFGGLSLIMSGGERLSPRHIARLHAAHPALRILNGYGTVECGVFASLAECVPAAAEAADELTIGTPPTQTGVLVVAREADGTRLRPVGCVGELAVTGLGLALGYLGQPAETEARFADLPDADGGTVRAYLTGDLGLLGDDGRLYYRGRADSQLKVRGVRVEPGAIESLLQGHPQVRRAGVWPIHDSYGAVDGLQAYVVPYDGVVVDDQALRAWLGERVPQQIVPRLIEPVAELPLTATGKLDRSSSPPRPPRRDEDAGPLSPGGVAAMMADVLSLPSVDTGDDFFGRGGDSLLATRLAARLGAMTGRHVSVADVVQAPSPRALASVLRAAGGLRYTQLPEAVAADDTVPISPAQEGQLVAFLTDRRGTGSIVQCAHVIKGPLDPAALARAWRAVVATHEGLRTIIDIRQSPPRQVVLPAGGFALELSAAASRRSDLRQEAARVAGAELRPLDITAEPLTRARLITADREAALVITQHHMVTDGWSERVMLEDLSLAYRRAVDGAGDADLLPDVPTYRSYTRWYLDTIREAGDELRAFWVEQLAGLPSIPPLAPARSDGPPRVLHWELGAAGTAAWAATASAHGASLLSLLLHRYARAVAEVVGAGDFAVGLNVAGRHHAAFDRTIGFFVNIVPVRVRPFDEDLGVAGQHAAVMAAVAHSLLPFGQIVAATRTRRSARHPLAQAMMVMQPGTSPVLRLDGCAVERVALPAADDPFELTLEAWTDGPALAGGLHCPAAAAPDLLDTIRAALFRSLSAR
jgi:amino acid adenylation domain-containing protein